MSVPESLSNLDGTWAGTNRLWLMPGEPVRECDTTLFVTQVAQEKLVALHNRWAYEGSAQDGLLLVGQNPQSLALKGTWIDSWHMQHEMMALEGGLAPDGRVTLRGSYAAPHGPDWGWQIELVPGPGDTFRMVMHNISPTGGAYLAVEATYARAT